MRFAINYMIVPVKVVPGCRVNKSEPRPMEEAYSAHCLRLKAIAVVEERW